MATIATCPRCGSPLVNGRLEGLCPKCVAPLAFDLEAAPSLPDSAEGSVPPNQPTWSINSKSIIFHYSLGGPDYDIWAISADGGTPQKVTGIAGDGDYDPCASNDGRFVAYAGVSQ